MQATRFQAFGPNSTSSRRTLKKVLVQPGLQMVLQQTRSDHPLHTTLGLGKSKDHFTSRYRRALKEPRPVTWSVEPWEALKAPAEMYHKETKHRLYYIQHATSFQTAQWWPKLDFAWTVVEETMCNMQFATVKYLRHRNSNIWKWMSWEWWATQQVAERNVRNWEN